MSLMHPAAPSRGGTVRESDHFAKGTMSDATTNYDPGMSIRMTSDRSGETELGQPFPAGTTVEYLGHLPGCAIRVRMPDGSIQVVSPLCFKELR